MQISTPQKSVSDPFKLRGCKLQHLYPYVSFTLPFTYRSCSYPQYRVSKNICITFGIVKSWFRNCPHRAHHQIFSLRTAQTTVTLCVPFKISRTASQPLGFRRWAPEWMAWQPSPRLTRGWCSPVCSRLFLVSETGLGWLCPSRRGADPNSYFCGPGGYCLTTVGQRV